jgi:hypothetical protein
MRGALLRKREGGGSAGRGGAKEGGGRRSRKRSRGTRPEEGERIRQVDPTCRWPREREEGKMGRRRGWNLGRWAGRAERGKRGEGLGSFSFFVFFFNLFKSFSNFKLFSRFKHFKPFASFQIILKSFKTSHKQIIKPCIQNMMHKHLLLLNY